MVLIISHLSLEFKDTIDFITNFNLLKVEVRIVKSSQFFFIVNSLVIATTFMESAWDHHYVDRITTFQHFLTLLQESTSFDPLTIFHV